jgi:exosome complex RNA-binding protein Csl4
MIKDIIMATEANIRLPETLLAQAQQYAAATGQSVDDLAAEAVKREIARRALQNLWREAEGRRGDMTDEQVEEVVNGAVHEDRRQRRGR